MRLPLAAALLLLPAAALAQTRGAYAPAPVPALGPPAPPPGLATAPPGLRSSDAGPPDATPFSAAGSGTLRWAGSAQADEHTRELSKGGMVSAPNLSR